LRVCVFLGEMCILLFIYSYVAVCRFCVVRCIIIICFPLLFSNYLTCFLIFMFLLCMFVFSFVYFVFLYCFVYYFSFSIHSCLFYIFVQVNWPLPPDGNPTAVNKYHKHKHKQWYMYHSNSSTCLSCTWSSVILRTNLFFN
jgi:hypothetical protein